jgi:sensor histidine kinase regulating citrate/malate metabolism
VRCNDCHHGNLYVGANARIQGDYLVLQVQNSYCGQPKLDAGRYISQKSAQPGIGLASVEALCNKYAGSLRITPNPQEHTWQTACMLNMHNP